MKLKWSFNFTNIKNPIIILDNWVYEKMFLLVLTWIVIWKNKTVAKYSIFEGVLFRSVFL
jgi:hypothetical protein